MSIITFDKLDKEIKKVGGKPMVLEALWDGDTNGWYLLLYLYTVTSYWFLKRNKRHFLGEVSRPEGDGYYHDGKITVALLAEEFGKRAIEKYNLIFYFPSKDKEDDDCPTWAERHLGISCEDCNKLILPQESLYLPKEICYPCYLKRKTKDSFRNAEPADDGYNFFLSKNDECINVGYCTKFEDFTIAPFIQEKVNRQLTKDTISIITLNKQDILILKNELEVRLERMLLEYEKPDIDKRNEKFIGTYNIKYKEQEYELMDGFNDLHREIANYISSIKTAERAIAENYVYKYFFKNGITYRDDAVLRFVNYVCKGKSTIFDIHQHYTQQLTVTDLSATLEKLERIGCVIIRGEQVSITKLGACLV